MKILINAVSAKRGGALTYLQNVLPELQRQLSNSGDRIVVWRNIATEEESFWPNGIEYCQNVGAGGGNRAVGGNLGRIWFDQVQIPKLMRKNRFDALFSTANFGPLYPVKQNVLLVRNTAYFDSLFLNRIRSLKVRLFFAFQRWLTLLSMRTAARVLFPSEAMLALVSPYFKGKQRHWSVAPYGVCKLPFEHKSKNPNANIVRLLHVSFYSDQKNLGTLLRAVEVLNQTSPRKYHLTLTAGFATDWLAQSSFFPNFKSERLLFRRLEQAGLVTDVGWKKHSDLAPLYQNSDLFVLPSYTESFGHPLVEAMAAGLPVVAANISISRELCSDAALYFSTFDPHDLASVITKLAQDEHLQQTLSARGLERASKFTWAAHAEKLMQAFAGQNN